MRRYVCNFALKTYYYQREVRSACESQTTTITTPTTDITTTTMSFKCNIMQ